MAASPEGVQPYTREPDPVRTFRLGHWEAMQLALALEARAEYLDGVTNDSLAPQEAEHVRALARIFSAGGHATYSLVVEGGF